MRLTIFTSTNRAWLAFFSFVTISTFSFSQTKSTHIQTIDGKKYYIHAVEKSQSLYGISKLYGVSLDELYKINPEIKSGIKPHQEIKVPVIAGVTASTGTMGELPIDTAKYFTHKIEKGETLYSLSKKYYLSEKQLLGYNPVIAQGLKENQIIITGEKNRRKSAPKEIKENKLVQTVREARSVPILIDSSLLRPVSKPKKTSYNVALLLPFKLDATVNLDVNELVKTNSSFPVVPGLAIDFYLGFKRAMDSLINKDFEVHLELYDIDDKDSLKLIEITASPGFKDLDFIFGPFYASGFKIISKKARELRIPVISPMARENKILYNNIYFSKTNPSQFTLLEGLADYCMDSLKKASVSIVLVSFDKDKKGGQFISAFKKYYNERLKNTGRAIADTISVVKSMDGVKKAYLPNKKNVVVLLSNNQVEVIDFITQLSVFSDKKDYTLCGWQTLSEMENLDQSYLNNLGFIFPHQYNLTNLSTYSVIIDFYKSQQETSRPTEYYYTGFDIASYYLKNLKELGPDFVYSLDTLPAETNCMRFAFKRPDNLTGFDNRGMYIFRYQDYKLIKTGWK